jgi:hypothetical protein
VFIGSLPTKPRFYPTIRVVTAAIRRWDSC